MSASTPHFIFVTGQKDAIQTDAGDRRYMVVGLDPQPDLDLPDELFWFEDALEHSIRASLLDGAYRLRQLALVRGKGDDAEDAAVAFMAATEALEHAELHCEQSWLIHCGMRPVQARDEAEQRVLRERELAGCL